MAKISILTPEQCRGARAMLDWTRDDLAEHAGVGVATLAEFEAGRRTPYDRTLRDIRRALEAAGIEIIDENGGGGQGLRLRKPDDAQNGKGSMEAVSRRAVKKPRGDVEGIAAAAY
jgi:transcriptional regulator with XRE-family HTH domain